MPYMLSDKLVVGITSRALFDLAEEDALFRERGLKVYRRHQRDREHIPLRPGTAFPLIQGLLAINDRTDEPLVEVIVISRNDADSGTRIMNSVAHHALAITRAAFTDGSEPWPYVEAFGCSLFLSAEHTDVEQALREGFPAALISSPPPEQPLESPPSEVRIAFDGDAVLFDPQSEQIYAEQGLAAFTEREAELSDHPMGPGPFEPFLRSLRQIQERFGTRNPPIRTALVTARGAPAHRRVVNTLRAWGVRVDESFFLGGVDKTGVLEVFRPHIFFDDQTVHLERAAASTPGARVVPAGSRQLQLFGEATDQPIPAEEPVAGPGADEEPEASTRPRG